MYTFYLCLHLRFLQFLIISVFVYGDVLVNDDRNRTLEIFRDMPADFGPGLTKRGITGYLEWVSDDDQRACNVNQINPPPFNRSGWLWIALIERGLCDFGLKVYNAQRNGYGAAIIFNNESDTLLHMGGGKMSREVILPSVFIGRTDGLYIGQLYTYSRSPRYTITLNGEGPLDLNYYLIPFAAVVGSCFLIMLLFMVGKWLRDYYKRNKSRVKKRHLRSIPTRKFVKGDEYDLCAICLEDYDEGEKLRELPCAHTYHCKCIDQWLTKSRGTCPVCTRKVFPHLQSESDSEDPEANQDERTPLLSQTPTTSGHGSLQSTNPIIVGVSNAGCEESEADMSVTVVTKTFLSSSVPSAVAINESIESSRKPRSRGRKTAAASNANQNAAHRQNASLPSKKAETDSETQSIEVISEKSTSQPATRGNIDGQCSNTASSSLDPPGAVGGEPADCMGEGSPPLNKDPSVISLARSASPASDDANSQTETDSDTPLQPRDAGSPILITNPNTVNV